MIHDTNKLLDYEQIYEQFHEESVEPEISMSNQPNEQKGIRGKARFVSNSIFGFLTTLQYRVKNLTAQVDAFESGQKYIDLEADYKTRIAQKDRENSKLKRELADADRQVIKVRNMWMQVNEDLVKAHTKELSKKDRKIKELEEQVLKMQIMLDAEKEKYKDKVRELYQVKTELEDEKGKNLKLTAQINRDYENSSKPSSLKPNHKKITNNREKTGKKPGGQVGHKGHSRKKHVPTNQIEIPAPDKYSNSPDYKLTGKVITKQLVDIHVEIIVDEYSTPEFRNVHTGQRVHAEFPEGLVNEVNYSGNIKAIAFLLNNRCNVSIGNVSEFLSELTDGELKISTGMISGLSKEFSLKTEAEQKKAFANILLSPVIYTDFTSARVNGKNMNVMVCANESTILYFAREHKGHEGVKGTPVEVFQGSLVHDHDRTFYNYGSAHQECLEHVSRYLKNSMDNEPNLQWNRRMRELIGEMIHFWNCLDPDDVRNPDQIEPGKVNDFETKFDEILRLAKDEYEYEPPTKYYREGFNLHKKLFDYRDNHLLFLHDRRIEPTNNLSERLLRIFKRKQHQVMVFRSWGGLDNLCDSLGVIASLRARGSMLYDSVADIFAVPINRSVNPVC